MGRTVATEGGVTRLQFPVKGMHCAACVGKVERALRAVPGVRTAAVSLATERAAVEQHGGGPSRVGLRRAVASAGYTVPAEIATTEASRDREDEERDRENRRFRRQFLVGAALSVPILLGNMHEIFPWVPHWLRNPWLLFLLTT